MMLPTGIAFVHTSQISRTIACTILCTTSRIIPASPDPRLALSKGKVDVLGSTERTHAVPEALARHAGLWDPSHLHKANHAMASQHFRDAHTIYYE